MNILIDKRDPSDEQIRMMRLANSGTEIDFAQLTNRERDVLEEMLKLNCTTKGIAQALVVTEKTVQTHFQNMFDKFDVPDRVLLGMAYYWWKRSREKEDKFSSGTRSV